MRIVAGKFGGRRLQAPSSAVTRPTSDRVRESLFSMLVDVDGASVLDLFAGTGALAIEALSRGAANAVLVEHDRNAAKVIEGNLNALGLVEPVARLLRGDAMAALEGAARRGHCIASQ